MTDERRERAAKVYSQPFGFTVGESSDVVSAMLAFADAEVAAERARIFRLEEQIRITVAWLEKNQPDVFSRGIWDALEAEIDVSEAIERGEK